MSGAHLAVLNWPHGDQFEPGYFIGSEGKDGEHLRDADAGWPYSVYRKTCAIGGCDVVLCHGIQNRTDAALLLAMCNAYRAPSRPAPAENAANSALAALKA